MQYRRVRTGLPKEGWAFIVILGFVAVCSILRNVNFLVVVSGMMFMPLLLCWRLNRHTIRNLLVRRIVPNRIHAGQVTSVKWEAENKSQIDSFNLRVTDNVNQVFSRNGKSEQTKRQRRASTTIGLVAFDQINVNQSAVSSYRIVFAERGIYEASHAIAKCDFPLGLITCWIKLNQPEQIHVAPQVGTLATNWKQIITSNIHGTAAHACVEGASGDDFFAIREYRNGDNKRKIHWRSTAKYRQPMVRQFERETEQDISIVIDLCADPTQSELATDFHDMYADCETVLSFAATVLSNWSMGDSAKLTIGIAGQNSEVLSSVEIGQFTSRVMRALAIANVGDGSQLEQTIKSMSKTNVSSGQPCIVISSRTMQQAARNMSTEAKNDVHWICCNSSKFNRVFKVSDRITRSGLDSLLERPEVASRKN